MLGPALYKQDTAQKMQKPERHTDNERDENHHQELGWQVKSKRQQDEDRYDQRPASCSPSAVFRALEYLTMPI